MIRFITIVVLCLMWSVNATSNIINTSKDARLKPSMDFLHFWISSGEVRAMNIFRDDFTQRGGEWSDIPAKNYQLMKIENSIRESKGFPVGSMLLLGGGDIEKMSNMKQIQPIDNIVANQSWQKLLRSFTIDALRFQNKVMAMPIAIHNENWAWYNLKIYDELNLTLPTTWDEFLVQAPIIEKAGYLPIAISDDYFSLRIFFSVLLSGIGGEDVYNRFFLKQDISVLYDSKFKQALSVFAKIRNYRFEKKHLHIWSDATQEVLENSAAMQIMGDWAKAEFKVQKKVLGKDFECRPAPNANQYFLAAIDVIAFPETETDQEKEGQKLFIKTIIDKKVQIDFNLLKGSTPPIKDVDIEKLDRCTQIGLHQLEHKENILYSPRFLMSESKLSKIRPLIFDFWKNNEMTIEEFVKNIKKVFLFKNK